MLVFVNMEFKND